MPNSKSIAVHTSAKARDYLDLARNGMNEALLGSQMQAQRKAQIQANTPPSPPSDPVVAASQSDVPFEQLLKANPAAAFHKTNGRIPNTEELQDFQSRMTPPKPVSGQEVIDKISLLL